VQNAKPIGRYKALSGQVGERITLKDNSNPQIYSAWSKIGTIRSLERV